eukprot:1161073-Pelagomonas_calceolata.AAC.1
MEWKDLVVGVMWRFQPFSHKSTELGQRGLSERIPKYAPFLHLKCVHSQPLHMIGAILALKCSWRYKLPEHML